MQRRDQQLEAGLELLLEDAESPPLQQQAGDLCPGCGRASVRLLQCGWLTAVRGCDQPDCLHPLLGPVRPVARPYTDIRLDLLPPQQISVAAAAADIAAPVPSASVVNLLTSLTDCSAATADSAKNAAASAGVVIGPEDVFVRCLCPTENFAAAAAAAAMAAGLFCRAPGGRLTRQRAGYRRCLRTVRATFRLSSDGSRVSDRGFRGLELDADMSAMADRQMAELDGMLRADLAQLLGSMGPECCAGDMLCQALRRVFRYCARTTVCFKQMCTVCFEQNTFRGQCTVLRVGCPAPDFDLSQPLKRVLLRSCPSCGAPKQRVLFAWEAPAAGGPAKQQRRQQRQRQQQQQRPQQQQLPSALVLESPDGLALSPWPHRGQQQQQQQGRAPVAIALAPGCEAEFLPAAVIERRRLLQRRSGDAARPDCELVVWLYSPECERWMAMTSQTRFACYEESNPGTAAAGACAAAASEVLAVVYERATPPLPPSSPATPAAPGGADCYEESDAESLDQPLEDNLDAPSAAAAGDAQPPTPLLASLPPPPSEVGGASSVSSSSAISLRQRLHSVMRSRRQPSTALGPLGQDQDFVMSRFLDVVTACAAAAPSSVGSRRGGIRAPDGRRLRSYAEDNMASASVSASASASPAGAAVPPAEENTMMCLDDNASDFDILSLFV